MDAAREGADATTDLSLFGMGLAGCVNAYQSPTGNQACTLLYDARDHRSTSLPDFEKCVPARTAVYR